MTYSSISYDKDGRATCFSGPDAVHVFRAATLSSAIGLLSHGITPTRGLTMKRALFLAGEYTGRKYKRTEAALARAHLTVWIETMKSALPTEER